MNVGGDGAIRPAYEAEGVDGFYTRTGATYRNPHEAAVVAINTVLGSSAFALDTGLHVDRLLDHVLDLACGSGEATLALRALGARQVDGVDPYTSTAYRNRTGSEAAGHSFADVADGALAGQRYSLVVCSYALHLCERSRLPAVCIALSASSDTLMVVSPHKRPVIDTTWGWSEVHAALVERVHIRVYRST